MRLSNAEHALFLFLNRAVCFENIRNTQKFMNTLKVLVRNSPFTSLSYHRIRAQSHSELQLLPTDKALAMCCAFAALNHILPYLLLQHSSFGQPHPCNYFSFSGESIQVSLSTAGSFVILCLLWEVPPAPVLQLPPPRGLSCANTEPEVQGAHSAGVQGEVKQRASPRQGYSVMPTLHLALLCPLSESREGKKRFLYVKCNSALVPFIASWQLGTTGNFFLVPFRDPSLTLFPPSPGKPDSTSRGCYGERFLWASLPWRNERQSCRQSTALAARFLWLEIWGQERIFLGGEAGDQLW